MTLGRIIVDLLARTGSFDTDLNRSAKLAQRRAKEIDNAFRKAGTAIGAALGISIAGAVTAVVAGVKKAVDNMDELRDASIRLGIGVETLSALRYAAQQTGTDFDTLGKGLKIFAKNAADALDPKSNKAKIFEALGVQVTDAAGNLRQLDALLPEVADKFKELQDGTLKAALAQELFGKSGLELTEFLNQGSDGLKKMTDRARELGIVIDQETADKADKFNDTLSDLKSAAEGLASKVAAALLPQLQKLAEWAVDFVSDGDNAAKIANDIADGFKAMADAAKFGADLLNWLDNIRNKLNSIQGTLIEISPVTHLRRGIQNALGFNDDWSRGPQPQSRNGAPIPKTPVDGMFSIPGAPQQFSAVPSLQDFSKYTSATTNTKALQDAISGAGGGGSKKTGKSDEEREAERLQQAYDRQNESLKEQVALFGQDGEAAKLRYALEFGELSKLDPAKKKELLDRAETLDLMEAERLQTEKNMEAEKKAAEEKLRGVEATDQLIKDMQFELDLLGLTNKEREKAIALRYADKNATDEQRDAIGKLSDKLYEASRVSEFWGEVQRDLSDVLYDTVTHAKSAGDAVKDFFDEVAKYILRAVADQWAEKIAKLFQANTTTASSSGGSGWGAAIGGALSALFGGGKASGGPVFDGGSYLVGEHGPEMFIPRMSGTIVPAPQTARMSSPGLTVVNNNNYAAPYDPRVEAQKNARTAFETNRALQRNR